MMKFPNLNLTVLILYLSCLLFHRVNFSLFQLLTPKFGISIEEVSGTRLEINHTGGHDLKWIFRTTVKV